MKTRSKFMRMGLTIATAILLAGFGVRAQGGAGAPPPPGGPGHEGPMRFDEIGFLGFEAGIGGRTVTGAPFTATFTTQSTQALADGNQIQHTTTGTFARDSQGRTRREMTLPAIGPFAAAGKTPPHAIFINDPVAGVSYILHADEKTADEVPVRHWKGRRAEGEPGAKRRLQTGENDVTTDLGTQMINGISAQGTRITRTIPAGAIGNAKPIVIVTERWYSPDLQTYVLTKRTDPMMGDTVTQLTNIQRQEPDATLFQVPSDYSVSQRGGRRAGKMGGQRPPADQ
ncbi:MAG TPA: hypothetical protein VMH00_01970 [Candidatus Limnocylindrales bacterium]|nr:hypothetical protein [Candidatus Limnocylindrales bacterium]